MANPSGEIVTIDMRGDTVTSRTGDKEQTWPMASAEAFEIASRAWLRCGWDVKHLYSFTWLGRPMLQLPEDMIRLQELIWTVRPDVIVETGVAHGGSLVFAATLCRILNKGRVIGVERGLYPENRTAIKEHILADLMTVIDGDSVAPETVAKVRAEIRPGETVLILLDSNHSKEHVLGELRAYAPLVSPGSYIIACDGIISDLVGAPRSSADWGENNAVVAAQLYLKENPAFRLAQPLFLFNESTVGKVPSYWKDGILRRQH